MKKKSIKVGKDFTWESIVASHATLYNRRHQPLTNADIPLKTQKSLFVGYLNRYSVTWNLHQYILPARLADFAHPTFQHIFIWIGKQKTNLSMNTDIYTYFFSN